MPMLSVPYSRYLFGFIPWYSFLIVTGAAIAIILAVHEEKKLHLKKDTVVDFALVVLPFGILGARIYYVLFSWESFKDNLLSILKIWEGGIAIYGAVIAGLLTALLFCKKKKMHFPTLCDIIAPGLVLAQAIGRWGNYFNQEAYGLCVTNESLQFFPFAVQIQTENGLQWHMATFFYESVWNFLIFIFLMIARRKIFRYHGDVITFYAILYACGRLIIEDFRMDSLYASSNIRISQLLSVMISFAILLYYFGFFRKHNKKPNSMIALLLFSFTCIVDTVMILWMTGAVSISLNIVSVRFLILFACSLMNILSLIVIYGKNAEGEIIYANNKK